MSAASMWRAWTIDLADGSRWRMMHYAWMFVILREVTP